VRSSIRIRALIVGVTGALAASALGERIGVVDMPSIDESGLAERACQLRTSKRVVEHQLPLARLEANSNLLTLLDLLAHHRSFLTPR